MGKFLVLASCLALCGCSLADAQRLCAVLPAQPAPITAAQPLIPLKPVTLLAPEK